jgi:hypothetical protein
MKHFAILGAGPTGLDAALALASRGHSFTVYEAAPQVGGHLAGWRHVRCFTPWSMTVSPRLRQALADAGTALPFSERICPTGGELIEKVLQPATGIPALRGRLKLGHRIVAIGREGLLKHEEIATRQRGERPFRLLLVDDAGHERVERADVVLDCTGNGRNNTLGDAGIPAIGEGRLDGRIAREIPNFDVDADRWAESRTLLVGAGHSAQTALRGLVELAERRPGTRVVWIVRGAGPAVDEADALSERQEVMAFARRCLDQPPACLAVRRAVVEAVAEDGQGSIEVSLRPVNDQSDDSERSSLHVDRVLSLTGRVGDHDIYRQLQVHECYATGAPMNLAAALIGQNGGSGDCLRQTSLGPETLRSPEPNFFILGAKSYGRRTDFLLRVGWQQVDEVLQLLG